MKKLEGKVAIVVGGGGGGIGEGIVQCLAEEGADVVINTIHEESAQKVAEKVKALGVKTLAVAANATDAEQVARLVQQTIDTFGKVDILVNVVGGNLRDPLTGKLKEPTIMPSFVDQTIEGDWNDTFLVNLNTHVLTCQAVVPHFRKQKSGKIVNIGSQAGKNIPGKVLPYFTAKAALIHFTKSLAGEIAQDNINVNCICVGEVFTPKIVALMTMAIERNPEAKGMTPEEYYEKAVVSRIPLKRAQTSEDIGRAVVFLVSEDARNITGQALSVDGGETMYN